MSLSNASGRAPHNLDQPSNPVDSAEPTLSKASGCALDNLDQPSNLIDTAEPTAKINPLKRFFKKCFRVLRAKWTKLHKDAKHNRRNDSSASTVVGGTQSDNGVYAIIISSYDADDPPAEHKITNVCLSSIRAKTLAMQQAREYLSSYNSEFIQSTKGALKLLSVESDYPTPASDATDDPDLPLSYEGSVPTDRDWAVCRMQENDEVDIFTRYWRHPCSLRWIKTCRIEVSGARNDTECHPPSVFTAYHLPIWIPSGAEDDTIYPVHSVFKVGSYWTKTQAKLALQSHMAVIGVDILWTDHGHRLSGGLLYDLYSFNTGLRLQTWWITQCILDETHV